jgi:hypothetical protein
MRLIAIGDLTHRYILQWNDATRLLVRGVLKVIQAIIVQDEPTTFPRLVPEIFKILLKKILLEISLICHSPSTLLPQPTLLVRIEERMHQIITIILWYFERLGSDGFV